MKITAIFGSPRKKKNSETISEAFLEKAEMGGAAVERYRLNDLKFRGCQGCYACKDKADECVLKDELKPVLDSIMKSDVVLIATPIYFFEVTAQLKTMVDRWFSYLKPDYRSNPEPCRIPPGKEMVFVVTQGGGEGMFMDVIQKYDSILRFMGFKPMHLIRVCNMDDINTDSRKEELLETAKQTAKNVLEGKASDFSIEPYFKAE